MGRTSSGSSPFPRSWLVSTASPRSSKSDTMGSCFGKDMYEMIQLFFEMPTNSPPLFAPVKLWKPISHWHWSRPMTLTRSRMLINRYLSPFPVRHLSSVNAPSRPWATRSISQISPSVSGDHTPMSFRVESPMTSITCKGIVVSASSCTALPRMLERSAFVFEAESSYLRVILARSISSWIANSISFSLCSLGPRLLFQWLSDAMPVIYLMRSSSYSFTNLVIFLTKASLIFMIIFMPGLFHTLNYSHTVNDDNMVMRLN